jgi:hypothetical protein
METRADGVIREAHPLFQAEGGGSLPTSALLLRLFRIPHKDARTLNRLWHSRLPRLGAGSRACYAAEFGGRHYAVAVWSRPLARFLPQWEWLELQRLAIAPDAPRNTASRVLAVMTRLVRQEFPDVVRLISYQDTEVHSGGIYRATGWTPTTLSGRPGWLNHPHGCSGIQSAAPKQRWEKVIRQEQTQDSRPAPKPEQGPTLFDGLDGQ